MENATKALLMGAGVLIGVMILSLAAYLFASFGGTAQRMQDQIDQGQLDLFNNQFISYQAKDCTVYDILSVVNRANEFNKQNSFAPTSLATTYDKNENYIKVIFKNKLINKSVINSELTLDQFFQNPIWENTYTKTEADPDEGNKFELITFKCEVKINEVTARVNYIKFFE